MTGKCAMDHISRIDRSAQFLAERAEMTYVVKMVVSHKNGRKGIHVQTVFNESLLKSSEAYSGIDQYPAFISAEIVTVAATSA